MALETMATGDLVVETVVDGFVGRISGLDLSAALDPGRAEALRAAWRDFPVLHFPDQSLSPEGLRRVGEVFGVPEPETPMNRGYLTEGEDAVSYVGNIHPDGTPYPFGNKRATAWHSDQSYFATPVSGAILHALRIPDQGGGTQFCNMYAAYDSLPAATKGKIENGVALHCYNAGPGGEAGPPLDEDKHGTWTPVRHPIVRTHPLSGRPALYVNHIHTYAIDGMAGTELLEELMAHATEPRFVYYHPWRVGDTVLWDQRCLMHKSAGDYPLDQARLLMRVKVAGDAPY